MDEGLEQATQTDRRPRNLSFGATMKAVFWSFFGVRKRKDYEDDSANLNPVHLIIGGLLGAAVFVAMLVLVVRIAVS